MNLYLFNPDADLAMADNTEHYILPAAIRRMACDLALLPAWYAEPGSAVVLPADSDAGQFQSVLDMWGVQVQAITAGRVADWQEVRPVPWGWNLSVRRTWLQWGCPESLLPSYGVLQQYRKEASREVAARRLAGLFGLPCCTGQFDCLTTLSDCRTYVQAACTSGGIAGKGDDATLPGCVLKAPWSGSGKGLKWCREGFTDSVRGWCERVLHEQACVVASPIYNKVKDFALEFRSDGSGKVDFSGYSSFSTNAAGAYLGNDLLAPASFERQIAEYVPLPALLEVRRRLEQLLSEYSRAGYRGDLGVDMMVCRTSSGYILHPAVEVNLRTNMGIVALSLQQRLLAPGCSGHFRVEHFPSVEALQRQHRTDEEAFPLCVRSGKVCSGYLSLAPVTSQGRYRAAVWVTASPSLP